MIENILLKNIYDNIKDYEKLTLKQCKFKLAIIKKLIDIELKKGE